MHGGPSSIHGLARTRPLRDTVPEHVKSRHGGSGRGPDGDDAPIHAGEAPLSVSSLLAWGQGSYYYDSSRRRQGHRHRGVVLVGSQ